MTGEQTDPHVAPGTLLRLDGDDWSFGRDLTPGTHVDVVVVRLRTGLAHLSDEWRWVLGHRPECAYPHVDEHPPCVELRVTVAALHRHTPAS
ncbi:hypothetical protein [Micromonospora coxensis]|uniref:Uncharacterized protein n=1 Tax=Micromonospora coxensis TaxID=356852 RepID=A0A1C5GY09_9ACTN|nr:hypothetical protein [Micromonospora coxensis]SCG38644.1 hypothetical protein GA0070614_0543 [Micromonospora coxensis]